MQVQDLGTTGGIIAIIIIAFAVIGFVKGLIRTVLAMVCLGIAGYTAFWGHEHAHALTDLWMDRPGPWIPKIIACITGLAVFFICRYLLHFLVSPFNQSNTGKRIGFGLPAALLSLCSGLTLIWLAFTGIRYSGSIAEIRQTELQCLKNDDANDASADSTPWLVQAKHSLDASTIGQWHQQTDPFYAPDQLLLCQILVMYHHPETRKKLLTDATLNPVFNHTEFLELAYQENIKQYATSGKHRDLFAAQSVAEILTRPDLTDLLQHIDPSSLSTQAAP
ncbi:MAG: CvpA family protein [Verrucomicrobiae bacterium]|nr:CvpA family protein [Verrucomicrobiae bacterium]NNJ43224.1 hypothetical protein [Akkermansiaceae bacterium]